jgi:hypothetical protein
VSDENNKVVSLKIPPKTLTRKYKTHTYTVTFIPKTKSWKWTVTVVNKMVCSEVAPSQVAAFRAAEKFIDQNAGGQR